MRTVVVGLLGSGLLLANVVGARAQTACESGRPNVVLIVMDDVGWTGVPIFNPPIKWNGSADPDKYNGYLSPTYNRLDARLFALPDGTLGEYTPSNDYTPLDDGFVPDDSAWQQYDVLPPQGSQTYHNPPADICLEGNPDCAPATDILPGHGGLLRMLNEGQAFTRFYATAGVCIPTRVSILTGKQGMRTGVNSNGETERIAGGGATSFPAPQVTPNNTGGALMTLPRLLKRNNYHTAIVGKLHVTTTGTDEAALFDDAIFSNECCRPYFDNAPMECAASSHPGSLCPAPGPTASPGDAPWTYYARGALGTDAGCSYSRVVNSQQDSCNFSVRGYADMAIQFIDHFQDDKGTSGFNGDRFFLYLAFNAQHDAHRTPDRTEAHYTGQPTVARNANYWALLEETDAAIGRILEKLEDEGLLNDTVVIFTADQGPDGTVSDYGDPRLSGKKEKIEEGGIRAPFLVRPCTPPEQRYNGSLASHVDLYRTIASMADITDTMQSGDDFDRYVADRDGVDLSPALLTGTGFTRNFAYARAGDRMTVISRHGLFRDLQYFGLSADLGGVCGFVPHPASTSDPLILNQAAVRGASKELCNPAEDTCEGVDCPILGERCVDEASGTAAVERTPAQLTCAFTTGGCAESLARCKANTDCPGEENCRKIVTECNRCMTAAFKFESGTGPALFNPKLHDLTTNPEENPDFDFFTAPTADSCLVRELMRCWANSFRSCDEDQEHNANGSEPPLCETGHLPLPPPQPSPTPACNAQAVCS